MTSEIKVLKVLLYENQIGTLTHLLGDKNLFTFDQDYIQNLARPTLSLSFKDTLGDLITNVKTTQTRLPPFFANLLPEGLLREYLARRANLNPLHEFSLLWVLGQDLPGALKIQASDNKELPFQTKSSNLTVDKKKETLLRFSLAGVQLKFSAIEKTNHGLTIPSNGIGGEWITKLPHTVFKGVPENEYAMMELARKVGIDVPETKLLPIAELEGLPQEFSHLGKYVFAIKRFDRAEHGRSIHIEDFAQVFGVYPEKKYKNASYRNIADVIRSEIGEPGIIEFIKRFVFNALIGNGDMHLKNWSLIYKEKNKASLAPAYDFVSTLPYLPGDQLALNFVDRKEFSSLTLDQFKRFAEKAMLSEKLVLSTVEETTDAFTDSLKTINDLPLKEDVHNSILTHLSTLPFWKSK
ncbi:MAG: HipA domain-containing protein [Chlamydiota bacterium]